MNDPEGGVIPTSGTQGGKTPQSGTHGSKGDIAWAVFALLLALLLSRIDEKVDQEYIVTLMAIYHRLQCHSAISLLYLLLFSIIMSSVISNNVQVDVRGPDFSQRGRDGTTQHEPTVTTTSSSSLFGGMPPEMKRLSLSDSDSASCSSVDQDALIDKTDLVSDVKSLE